MSAQDHRAFRENLNRLLLQSTADEIEEITSGYYGKIEITMKAGKVVNIKKQVSVNIEES